MRYGKNQTKIGHYQSVCIAKKTKISICEKTLHFKIDDQNQYELTRQPRFMLVNTSQRVFVVFR